MRFPIIRVKDRSLKREHIVGTDVHDQLIINNDQTISYYNLQNGEGTGEHGGYCFVGKEDEYFGVTVEFVTFEELRNIYEEECRKAEEVEKALRKFLMNLRNTSD